MTIEEQITFYEKHLEKLNKNAGSLDWNFVQEERIVINEKINKLKKLLTPQK